MPLFPPDRLAAWTHGRWTALPAELIRGFNPDSRTVQPGQVFVALRTDKRDGHDFLGAAAESGAVAALVGRLIPHADLPQLVVADPLAALQEVARLHRRASGAKVIGVTGSAGKTSTKNLLARLLGDPPAVLATEGNLNNFLGVPLTLARLEPGATRTAVIEAGINMPGEMRGLAQTIQPDHAIVTLVAPAHLERLGSIETVAHEKSELLRWLPPGGLAVFPWDAWQYPCFRHVGAESCVAVPASTDAIPAADRTHFVRFSVLHDAAGTEIVLHTGGLVRRFRLRRVSDGMAQNAVLALLLASALGVTDEQLQRRLAGWEPTRLRGELRDMGERKVYLDCYNANPASMADALAVFQQLAPPALPRLYILGGMEELGAAAVDYHRRLGATMHLRDGDCVWTIGPHAAAVEEGMLAAGNVRSQVHIAADLDELRAPLAAFRGAVFVKGSRRFQLESLFAATPVPAGAH
ncbi:MAG TPA: UDP-N-acetylmuramoyl-tripeptide--D-alanyl-D-alanine ligase [Opitutaceae bacterium]|nr:UDP-N-acetylmuramoyl-tripeptide--D-alanyl-D-alanine ligase [Opitutaceae bacterium]